MKKSLFLIAMLLLLICSFRSPAGELLITSPIEGAVINGAVNFTAEAKDLPALVSVAWRLNGRLISGNFFSTVGFTRPWHPAEVFDGPMSLQAVGSDIFGKVVAASKVVRFTADSGPGDMKLDEPVDISKTLSGVVPFKLTAIRPLTDEERQQRINDPKFDQSQINKTVEAIQIFIDGKFVKRQFGSPTCSLSIDTTRIANGNHEFLVTSYAWLTGVPPIAMMQFIFATDNGHAPMQLLPGWDTLILQAGESAQLTPRMRFTDGDEEKLKVVPVYAVANTEVATVDDAGKVVAVGKGETQITLTLPAKMLLPDADEKAEPFVAKVRVVVGLPQGLPHFSRNGRILQQYDPEKSVFVRSMFSLSPKYVLTTPGLAELVKDAGINTCESGFFMNPNDGSKIPTLEKYIEFWDPWFEKNLVTPAKTLDVGLIFSGDDWVRTANELKWTASTPWALDVAKHIWGKMRDSNTVTAIEMMDEASFLGNSPAPTDGHWAKQDPAIHDNALVNLINAIRSVPDYTPISWPVLGLAGPDSAHNWMGDPRYADYASQYWTTMDWRLAYPWGGSGIQMKNDLERVMIGRFPKMQWDKPQLMLVSGCGPYYTKLVEGDHYQAGKDGGPPSQNPASQYSDQPLYAALSGASGVRCYSTDFMWKPERTKAPLGTGGLQTGTSPFGAGSDRWHALSAAYNTLGKLEPYLLQTQMNAISLGDEFSVGARQSKDSRLLMAINWSQMPRTIKIDLSPYQLKGVKTIEIYRVLGGTSSVELIPVAKDYTVTFEAGEFIAWLFREPQKEKDSVPPEVKLLFPYEAIINGPVTLRATAKDDVKMKEVEFFANGKSLGIVEKAPYELQWTAETDLLGEWHGLKAVATDSSGNKSEARAMVQVVMKAEE